MITLAPLTRRRFLAATACGVSASLISNISRSYAAPPVQPFGIRSTDHFWYRLAPASPYIDAQRGSKAFGFGDGKIFLSEDNGWIERGEVLFIKPKQ